MFEILQDCGALRKSTKQESNCSVGAFTFYSKPKQDKRWYNSIEWVSNAVFACIRENEEFKGEQYIGGTIKIEINERFTRWVLEQTTKQASSSKFYSIKETLIIIVFKDNKRPRERERESC